MQLRNTTTLIYAFLPAMNKSLHTALVKIHARGGDSLFHSCYDGIIARKMLPMQYIFHQTKQTEVRKHSIWTIQWVWCYSLSKISPVLNGLQTGMRLDVIMLQEKSCLVSGMTLEVWAFSWGRVDNLSRFLEIQKDHPLPISEDSAHHFTLRRLHLEFFFQWGIHVLPLHRLLFWLWLIVVTLHLVTSNDAIWETATFSLALVQ